jgi:FAD:protein FMN transferase
LRARAVSRARLLLKPCLGALGILSCIFLVQACSAPGAPITRTRALPFAQCTLTLYDHAGEAAFAACFDRIDEILGKFNMYSTDSEISLVNRTAASAPVSVSEDFREALHQGLQLAALTDGMFDPTVGPLVKLWGVDSDKAHVPKPEDIRAALRLIGWRDVILDDTAGTVTLRRPGMTLDFGALLKGFAAVETGRVLTARGVRSAIIDVGGSVLALGSRPDGTPWRIGIQKPDAPRGVSLGRVEVRDAVVNTSGSYEQFFSQNGRRYQHIMDPHTGYPIDNSVESVTVIADRLHNGDGPSLSVLALGVEKGLALAAQLGIDVIIVGSDRRIHMTPGATRRFTLVDSSYAIVPD